MTAVEGLPTGARERLAAALQPFVWSTGDVDGVLGEIGPIIAALCDEARAADRDLRDRAAALADDLDRLYRLAGRGEPRGSVMRAHASALGLGYRRAALRLRDVLAGYEGSLYYGALPWLRGEQQPTCQQPHTVGDTTWRCLRPAGHDGQHEDSAGQPW